MTPDKRVEEIERIKKEVEVEYQMCGLSDGLYGDYATEVALRTLTQYHQDLMSEVKEEFLQVVSDNAEDYIKREKKGFPLPTVEEEAVRGFVQYLNENTYVIGSPKLKPLSNLSK